MSERNLVVLSAGLSWPSSTRLLADQLAAAAVRALAEPPRIEEFAVGDYATDVANTLATGVPGGELRTVLDQLAAADGVIAVTPLLQSSPGGLFKWFFDAVDTDAVAGKPVLIGAIDGAPRHARALERGIRPMFSDLGAEVVPTAVYVASEDRGCAGESSAPADLVERAVGEFAALIDRRPSTCEARRHRRTRPPGVHARRGGRVLPAAAGSR
ncbi:CE1759 family FMN reductase [Amycolatopsis sp. NPDC051903]|uniref:CE1759 family FMN reductase n=1 Tax=Amycolatopsis sp. NPDC051903 TaxID=3363936 RepID=UPI0037962385